MRFRPTYILLCLLACTITAHAQNIDSLRKVGRENILSENYVEAEAIYTAILKWLPGDTASLDRRGYAYARMKKHKQAFADFNNVLERYPENFRALLWRAEAYSNLKEYAKAIADLDVLLRVATSPFDSVGYNQRGLYKQNAGDFEGAIKDYEKAISLAPANALYYMNLGDALCDAGRCNDGLVAMEKGIAFMPGDAHYHTTLADHFVKTGNDSAAIAEYDKSLLLNATDIENSANILYKRAMCKYKVGDYAGSVRDLNIVSSTWGNYKELFYYRGLAKIAMGNKSSGCDDLTEAKNLGEKKAKQEIKKNCR